MVEESAPKRRGRPATGITPKRNVRIGETWDRAEEIEKQLAELTGQKPNITSYVHEALRHYNARMEKLITKLQDEKERGQ